MAKLSPQRLSAFRTLWRAVRDGTRPGAPRLDDRVRALPRMFGRAVTGAYSGLGLGRVVLIVVAIAYLVSPIDLVPEAFLAVLGLGDDAVVALWLGGVFLVETQRFLDWERTRQPRVAPASLPMGSPESAA